MKSCKMCDNAAGSEQENHRAIDDHWTELTNAVCSGMSVVIGLFMLSYVRRDFELTRLKQTDRQTDRHVYTSWYLYNKC